MTADLPPPDPAAVQAVAKPACDWQWYYSLDGGEWWNEAGSSREGAIDEGRESLDEPDQSFEIAQCRGKAPYGKLFDGGGMLGEHIDNQNEDNSYEEPFCEEAGLTDDQLEALATEINDLWQRFLVEHKPRGRSLDCVNQETVSAHLAAREGDGG